MWWSSSSGRIELQLTKTQACNAHHSGQCDDDVVALMKVPTIKRQLDKLDKELVVKELKEYGAWNDKELEDHQQNLMRLVWIAAGDIQENII